MSTILITGKAEFFTKKALERISENNRVVVTGRKNFFQTDKNIHFFQTSPVEEKFGQLFDVYTFDAVWYVSGYTDGGEGIFGEPKMLEQTFLECGRSRVGKLILLSGIDSQNFVEQYGTNGAALGKEYPFSRAFEAAQLEELAEYLGKKTRTKAVVLRLPYVADQINEKNFLGRVFDKMMREEKVFFPGHAHDRVEFISMQDLIDLLFAVTEETEDESGSYFVTSGYQYRYDDLEELLKVVDPKLQIVYFLDILTKICEEEYPYTAFADLFHTVRSMMLPVLYILQSDVPKADIYHSIATGYSGILARLGSYLYHVPYMITEHGIYTREREEEIIRAKWVVPTFKRFWVRFFYMLSAGAYDKASMVTCLFDRARTIQMELGVDPEHCLAISNGIHFERFCDIPMKKENGYVDIGTVLRIAPIKDVKTMIYAFAELKERVPNARLHIAGPEDDKEYAKECYDLVEQLKVEDILFLGTVNVLEYMANFDFTILTSISEGQPLAVLESFAAGRPCVTTDVGCCKELINGMEGDDLGIAGYCVPPMHRQAICDAMESMCVKAEERYQMGIVGKKRVERYFRHEDMIRNYQNAYDEVMGRWQG